MSFKQLGNYKLINKHYMSLYDADIQIVKQLYPNYNLNNLLYKNKILYNF